MSKQSGSPERMRWMTYGANGYTGELIAREAARRGLKPVLAGRRRESVEELARTLGLEAASGLTSYAETISIYGTEQVFVDGDDLHPPANVAKMSAGRPLDDADRAGLLGDLGAFDREAGRTAGAGDDRTQTARGRGIGVFEQHVRRAMRGNHTHFMGDAECIELLSGVAHRLPVRARAHHDAHAGRLVGGVHGGPHA